MTIKRYWDVPVTARAALSEQQVREYLDVELMEKGVLKPEPPKIEQMPAAPQMTTELVYAAAGKTKYGHSRIDIGFKSEEHARAFLRLGPVIIEHVYDLDHHVSRPVANPKIEAVELAPGAEVDTVRAVLAERKRVVEANEKANEEYVADLATAEKASGDVWTDWRSCRETEERHAKVRATLAEYVRLTEGDEETARRFLSKAYPATLIESALATAA